MAETTEKPDYDTRRRHIRAILYAIETEIRTVALWTGREGVHEYRYLWQVLNATPGKRSEKVLEDIEDALQRKGYWISYGELDISRQEELNEEYDK